MSDNLDTAVKKCFLFNIQFRKPTMEDKQQVWMDKLLTLPQESAQTLAMDYDKDPISFCIISYFLQTPAAIWHTMNRIFAFGKSLPGGTDDRKTEVIINK